MSKSENILTSVQEQGVLPLFFHADPEVCKEVVKVLYEGGVRNIEFTNRGEKALENFKVLRKLCNEQLTEMNLGVGTIKTKKDAENFIAAGADFIVSPGLVEEVVQVANDHEMLFMPGCMTPSEVIRAQSLGAKIIKLFPGSLLGPGFVKAIKPVFSDLLFMPTGGVSADEENLQSWFDAGVCAVGMGSKLIRKDLLQKKAYSEIKELSVMVLKRIADIRASL